MKFNKMMGVLSGAILVSALMFPVFPLAGIGVHYGLDYSLSMPDAVNERASLGDMTLDVSKFGGTLPSGYTKTTLTGADLPVSISRTGWERHPFNMGAKIYIDIIPFIDALELSANYGMWQYQGLIKYPTSITFNTASATNTDDITKIATINYDSTMVTLKGLGLDNPFLKNTPYAKLQLDLTVRKYVLKIPPVVNIVKVYAGAGASTFFATPLLSAGFVEKTLGNTLAATSDPAQLRSAIFDPQGDAMKKLGQQFFKDLMTPHYGAHVDVGAILKFPVMPVGLYVDGKFLLPFGNMDDNVSSLKSTGFLLNGGLLFAL